MPDLSRKNSMIARMAGNIAGGLVRHDSRRYVSWRDGNPYVDLDNVAQDSVRMAQTIVARLEEAEAAASE